MVRKIERSRAANFTKAEERLLLKIVISHIDVIENKKTDAVSNAMKAREWEKIELEFNSQNLEIPRDAPTLKTKYENFKRGVKKKLKLSQEKLNQTNTEDGCEETVIIKDEPIELPQVTDNHVLAFENVAGSDNVTHHNQSAESFFLGTEMIDNGDSHNFKIENESYTEVDIEVKATEVKSFQIENLDTLSPVSSVVLPLTPPSITVQPSVVQVTQEPIVTNYQCFGPKEPSSLVEPSLPALETEIKDHPLNGITSSKVDIEQENLFRKQLHELKLRHLEEEHALRKQFMEQQIRHAEEQQSWLRMEHNEKMKKIKSSI